MSPQNKLKKGQASKTIVITIIVIVLLLALVWFFWGKQFVGQAIYTGATGSAGFSSASSTFNAGEDIILTVGANIGASQTLGAEFTLTLPEGVDCKNVAVESLMDGVENLTLADNSSCTGNNLFFRYFALNFSKSTFLTETFNIAKITIKGGIEEPGDYSLEFSSFEIVNYDNYKNLVTNTVPTTITITFGEEDLGKIAIEVKDKSGKIAENTVSLQDYTIKATITPSKNLPANHLVLITINVEGTQKAQFWHVLPELAANQQEEVSFTYTFPKTEDPIVIKAMVWKNLLTEGKVWESLTPAAKKEYIVTSG